ncbi:hypothetical protein C8R44DRAFT_871738 [Mycena epipterygia]|nr:hypothetical protein C8R44DRAFT_871738 [Mycena epipterygia]
MASFPISSAIPDPPHAIPDATTIAHIRELVRSRAEPPHNLPSTISKLSAELARYDDEIARLRARRNGVESHHALVQGHPDWDQLDDDIARLVAQRTVIQAHCNDCCGLLAPIRHLPSEILVLIFGLCRTKSPSHEVYTAHPDRSTAMSRLAQAPLLAVAQVCVGWRGDAMGTPSLWDTIELGLELWQPHPSQSSEDFNRQIDQSMALLNLALERGNSPLNVYITGTHRNVVRGPAIELLAKHSERWKMLSLNVSSSELQYLSSAKGKLPVLETIVVNVRSTTLGTVDFFEVVPSLRTFVLVYSLSPSIPKLPFEQLHTVEYSRLESTEVALIVARMAELSCMTKLRL